MQLVLAPLFGVRYSRGVPRTLVSKDARIASFFFLMVAAAAHAQPVSSFTAADQQPWRLASALRLPRWLRFELEQRTRFEHLQNDFRLNGNRSSTALSMRTLLSVEFKFEPIIVGAELQDARVYATAGTPLSTTLVNPFELLQLFVGLRRSDVFVNGDAVKLTLGRLTLDVGSRRLVARNDFRNTINGFTGVDLQWTGATGTLIRAFAALPVSRQPSAPAALAANQVEFDRETTEALFCGLLLGLGASSDNVKLEWYTLGLLEGDGDSAPSANRKLVTPGIRMWRPPAAGQFDGAIEAMLQLGTSRATAQVTDGSDLTHRAASVHVSAGYWFDVTFRPRLSVQYDFATGDDDRTDGVNSRFDQLFGARRFEFGPTGIYGAIARSNINSPGARLEMTLLPTIDALIGQRLLWLASARDAWTSAGLVDSSGQSGQYVGQQTEVRLRWYAVPKNLSFELGASVLFRGRFARTAPGSQSQQPLYFYGQLTGNI